MVTLEFLGVGSFFTKTNYQNNLLINKNILIDCGITAGRSLYDTKRSFAQIEHIFITHTHADHIGGLEECAFFNKFMNDGTRPNLYLPKPLEHSLWDHSLRGGLEDIESGGAEFSDYFNVIPVESKFEIEGIHFNIVPTFHVPNKYCCGLSINDQIYFSGDTQFSSDMVLQHGSNAQIIFHDCQFFNGGIHASLDELCTLPEDIRQKTWLMHCPDDFPDHEARATSEGFTLARQHTEYTFE